MREADVAVEPDLDTPITLTLTPAALMDALFASADSVHTGWDSCVEASLVVSDMTVVDDASGNYCRLVEQEYVEDESPEVTWHDWAVELKLGEAFVTGHWRVQVSESPSEWDWCVAEAEEAFTRACVLVGKRVRRGLVVEEPLRAPRPSRTHH